MKVSKASKRFNLLVKELFEKLAKMGAEEGE